MEHLYDIIIEGLTVYQGLTEEEFFDTMSYLSKHHYESGETNPPLIEHKTYLKEQQMFGKTQEKVEKAGKKTRQGRSNRTRLSATSSRPKQKRYRGQGRG